jgi:large subunit ribosomal protein L6
MSRIGKLPITLPAGVTVSVDGAKVTTVGPKGTLELVMPAGVTVTLAENQVLVNSEQGNLHGLVRSLLANNVHGVSEGWSKSLELSGTGYRAATTGKELNLALGFSHPVILPAPAGITFQVVENKITVSGPDKALVGEIAAKIRSKRPADPYKAKGLKYEGEVIRRKAGKAAKAGGAAK